MAQSESASLDLGARNTAARLRPQVPGAPALYIETNGFAAAFDRQPFGFSHNLHTLDLFRFDSLLGLAQKYAAAPRDYFVAAAAASAATEFESVPHGQCTTFIWNLRRVGERAWFPAGSIRISSR